MRVSSSMGATLLACLLAAPAFAQPSSIRADQPWARATAPQQQVGSAYVTLTSPAADRLIGASSPAAARVTVHAMQMDGTTMQMRQPLDGLPLPAGQSLKLSPGGYHLMLDGLTAPLVVGQAIAVQLRFAKSPPLDLTFQVAPAGAREPGLPGAHGQQH